MGLFDNIFNKKNRRFNNQTLRNAVKEWLNDPVKTQSKYGHIGVWNTSDVSDMSKLFENAKSFNQPIGDWDVSNVTNMYRMFSYAHEFNQPLDNWNVSKVENMSSMFGFAKAFNQNIDNWNTSKVNNLDSTFFEASSFDKPLNKWDMNNASNMRCMFLKASSFNQPVGNWNVSNVTNMDSMFKNAKAFNQDISNWDLSGVTNIAEMLDGTEYLKTKEDLGILTFFNNYISKKEKLELNIPEKLINNIFYRSIRKDDKEHILIFFEYAGQAVEKFREIIKPHCNDEIFFKLKTEQISNWINKYESEIIALNIEGCLISLSIGVSLHRIDISPKGNNSLSEINSVNKNNTIIFTYPFSSPITYNLPEQNLDFTQSECLMIASIYFNTLDIDNANIPLYEDFYNDDDLKVFSLTEDFKTFWNYADTYVFKNKIDPLQTDAFKKIFEKLNAEFTLFERLNISFQLSTTTPTCFIENHNIDNIINYKKNTEKIQERLRLNKYFGIQDGEFILFCIMKNKMDVVLPYLNWYKNLEVLFNHMKNESDKLAIELRKKLIGDLPLNLNDRPTDIKVDQKDDNDPFSNYSEKTLELYKKAVEYLKSRNHQLAELEFKKVIDEDKHMLPAYYNLSHIYINYKQDFTAAVAILDKVIESQGYEQNPDDVYASLYSNRGLAKSYQEEEEEAIKDFTKAIIINPKHIQSFGGRGFSMMSLGLNQEAINDFDKAILLGDISYANYYNRGKCKQSMSDFKGALDDYDKAYELEPHRENDQRYLLQAMKNNGLMDMFDKDLEQ